MASIGASSKMLEFEGCSAVIKKPKYKRRRVSAVRDFPPGCGPSEATFRGNAGQDYTIDPFLEVEKKMSLSSTEDPSVVLEAGELELLKVHNGTDSAASFPGVEKIKTSNVQTQSPASLHAVQNVERSIDQLSESENKNTSSAAKIPCSSNGVENAVQIVLEAIEHELMMDEYVPDISGESLPEILEQSRDLVEHKQEEKSVVLSNDGKKISVQVDKMFTSDKLPPLKVISPKDVCKKKSYPPRSQVSAIRDFPPGCGTNSSYSSKRPYTIITMAELQRNMSGEKEKTQPAYDRKMEKGSSGASDTSKPAENSRQEKDSVVKKVRFRLKPYHYEPKKDNEEKKTVVGTGKVLPPTGTSGLTDAVARNKVRETLRLFQALTRKFMQRDEPSSKEQKHIRRIDLHALNIFKEKGLYKNDGVKIMGHVPGVEVGAEFHYRVELMIIGLHLPSQSGIGCMKQGGRSVAISVVDSGGYDNRVDDYDVWTYTGQGGNLTSRDKAPEDQKLERGNLALKNSIKARNLVRVIRGVKDTNCPEVKSKVSTKYTYFGVYTVERYWQEIGARGIKELKFELKRVAGQRELHWKKLKGKTGLCVSDIAQGKEQFPIRAVNTVDSEKPPPFTYIRRMIYPSYKPLRIRGCDCVKACSNSCSCVAKNGGAFPYNFDGAIVEAKPIVYECGPCCKCTASCYNRVSQLGITFPLEIFKTETRGWGVRSPSSIPSGGFICEYTGELLEDKEAEKRVGDDEYLFDIGQNRNDHSIWDGLSSLLPPAAPSSEEVVQDSGFTIDAAKYGNVGRFVNHSCSPNLYAQNVLYDHGDTRVPHIMLFAAENIPPLQELTYHYNYKLGQVLDQDGNVKVKNCYCGSPDCIGRLY